MLCKFANIDGLKVQEKYPDIIAFWKGFVKSKHAGQSKPGTSKSYVALSKNFNDALVLLTRRFFEEFTN